jgi:hypothetical protein
MVKSKTTDTLITNLTEVFKALKVYKWKLNPTKCIFGIPSDILLGNIISRRSTEANLEKIAVVTNMKPPTCIKDVQKLTWYMEALSHFISCLGRKDSPSSSYSRLRRNLSGRRTLTRHSPSSSSSSPHLRS